MLTFTLLVFVVGATILPTSVNGWRSQECPIESQDNKDRNLCIRPCDFDDALPKQRPRSESDSFFIIFFPPKNREYEESRFKCPTGFKQTIESRRCFCERSLTSYELELQQREKCDGAFEKCRMYGAKPYDCNHIVKSCPANLIRDYCLAGKVYKMRFATVVYEFCHAYLRLPNNGKRQLVEPDVNF